MKSTPDPAFCFVTSIHTDVSKTFHRIEQARHDEAKTGLAIGAIRAHQAESFRQEKLAKRLDRSGTAGAIGAVVNTSPRNAS
jgi:hypothetical protein